MNLNTANAYFSKRAYIGRWDIADDLQKESLLVTADLLITAHYQITSNEIPDNALLEQVLFMANKGTTDVTQIQDKNVKYFKASVVSESYFEGTDKEAQAIAPMASLYLTKAGFKRVSGGINIEVRR